MDKYEAVFRSARHERGIPIEITEKLDKWRNTQFSEEDMKNWEKQDLIYDIALFLWSAKRMKIIAEYSSKFESDEEDENVFKKLVELCDEIDRVSDRHEKEFLYAKGFCLVYEFDIAVELLEGCLKNKEVSTEFNIKVRELLDEIFTYYDNATQKEADANIRELIKLRDFDIVECRKYLKHAFFYYSESEEEFIVEVLKKHNKKELWDIFYENNFREEKYLASVYEKVKPEVSLSDGIYMEVLEYWLDEHEYQKIGIEIDRIKSKFGDSLALKRFQVKNLLEQDKIDDASKLIDEILLFDVNDLQTILYKMQVLLFKKEYLKVLELIEKYGEKYELQYVFWKKVISLVESNKREEAISYFVDCYNSGALNDIFITAPIAHKELPESVMISVLDKLIAKNQPEKDWGIPSIFLPYVFDATEDYERKGELRYYLINLYLHVRTIKNMLKINPKEVKEIYHYSQPETLNYLPKYSEKIGGSKLRLGNVAYLNDPEEGKVFYEILKTKNCSALELMLEHNDLLYENTYLACFSRKDDFLPMWVQYAKDGAGNCYAIETSIFNQYESELEERLYRKYTYNRFKYRSNQYVLYRVFYYGSTSLSEGDEEILAFCDVISNILNKLKPYFEDSQIKDLVNQLLSDVRYLFKDVAYSSEDEVRVICTDYYDEKLIESCGDGNYRFYMELDSDIYFNRVILGPKATDIKKKATYLSCCQNVGRVEQSTIKYV